ncbi:enoyl-CoA hydratase [Bradyrhizobium sp. USDA 4461]
MAWEIECSDGVAVVWMDSNKVNRQNPDFFADLEAALDRLSNEYAELPVVLTSSRQIFSAGFDFDYWFPLIRNGDIATVQASYDRFKQINLRLFSYPRPTIAAINGHAYAGGLITAFCCDFRVAVEEDANVTLNEVPIGLAMPSLFTEIIRYAVGTPVAAKATLTGRIYSGVEALEAGIVDVLSSKRHLLETAKRMAKNLAPDCLAAYSFSKEALQAPTIKRIHEETDVLDRHFGATWCSDGAKSATARTYTNLKSRRGTSS